MLLISACLEKLPLEKNIMGLSSNVLWHQTKKDGLMNILRTRKLYFSYCLENILSIDKLGGIAFPMISLCDLPLSEFSESKWAYGDYAIGLSREWGKKMGFNPVCYCHSTSDYLNRMLERLMEASASEDISVIEKAIFPFSYMKLVEGPLLRKRYKNYRFYDEKEVRLVPHQEDIKGYSWLLSESQYSEYKKKKGKSILGEHGVDFSLQDVRYIIVGNENNRKEVQKMLNKQKVDYSHIVILTKMQVLGDILGNNHNLELPPNNIGIRTNIIKLAKQVNEMYLKENKE